MCREWNLFRLGPQLRNSDFCEISVICGVYFGCSGMSFELVLIVILLSVLLSLCKTLTYICWPISSKLFVISWSGFAVFVSIAKYVHADILYNRCLFKPKLRELLQWLYLLTPSRGQMRFYTVELI